MDHMGAREPYPPTRLISQKDGSRVKVSSLKGIRAVIDRYPRQNPHNKPWPMVGDHEFNKANVTLNAVCRILYKVTCDFVIFLFILILNLSTIITVYVFFRTAAI